MPEAALKGVSGSALGSGVLPNAIATVAVAVAVAAVAVSGFAPPAAAAVTVVVQDVGDVVGKVSVLAVGVSGVAPAKTIPVWVLDRDCDEGERCGAGGDGVGERLGGVTAQIRRQAFVRKLSAIARRDQDGFQLRMLCVSGAASLGSLVALDVNM